MSSFIVPRETAAGIDTLELDRPSRSTGGSTGRVDLREAATAATVGDVMTRGQINVEVDKSFVELCTLFVDRAIHAAPVVDTEGRLIGVVSEGDIVRWQASRNSAPAETLAQVTAETIMTQVAHALPERAPLAYAFGLLAACRLRQAPVVQEDGRVVGMITATDLLRWIARDLGYVLPE